MKITVGFGAALLMALVLGPRAITAKAGAAAAGETSCERLASLTLPNATVTAAQTVAAGTFAPPAGGRGGSRLNDLPAFCRVAVTLTPSSDSDIKVEVWLPTSGWNGKFQAVGNGGWAGVISYNELAEAIRRGYAASSTDTGHTGNTGSFAFGHPEKLIDFGYRSEHEMTVTAKAIVNAFYGSRPQFSYWNGCSTGGRQGLKEAQRYPDDFDGIIAGAPANPRSRLQVASLWVGRAVLDDPASFIPTSKYPLIHRAALEACDANDGLKDGLIDDPRHCRFDPKVLQCQAADGPSCLTKPQVEAARKILGPVTNPRTGAEIYPGLQPGSELGWARLAAGPEPLSYAVDSFKYVVFKDPNWSWRAFDFDHDVDRTIAADAGVTDAADPNLAAFSGRGGKLLLYHGWADPQVSPLATINYHKSVMEAMGGPVKTASWVRLFMLPGMGHCNGGDGPNTFDAVGALERWVEKGQAPERIIASHSTDGKVDRTRPLCPYPQVASHTGAGSADDAANFACRMP